MRIYELPDLKSRHAIFRVVCNSVKIIHVIFKCLIIAKIEINKFKERN